MPLVPVDSRGCLESWGENPQGDGLATPFAPHNSPAAYHRYLLLCKASVDEEVFDGTEHLGYSNGNSNDHARLFNQTSIGESLICAATGLPGRPG